MKATRNRAKRYLCSDRIDKDEQTLNFPDGKIFIGDQQAGIPNGEGSMFFNNGKVISGEWINGEFLWFRSHDLERRNKNEG